MDVGLELLDLDLRTRVYMVSELDDDKSADQLYVSPLLTAEGRRQWPDLLRTALNAHDSGWLADTLQYNDLVESLELRGDTLRLARVAHGAPRVLADGQFNCYYMRGVCRRASDEGFPAVEVYRADPEAGTCSRSESLLRTRIDPDALLAELRARRCEEPDFGMPAGPRAGLSVRIPRA